MFHHFHDDEQPVGQGSISSLDFENMIDWLDERYSLIGADEYQISVENGTLSSRDVCLSFDDALLSQYEFAAPILKKRNLEAFFFVYSEPFCGTPNYFEIFRYFRTVTYANIDVFFADFFEETEARHPAEYDFAKSQYNSDSYLNAFSFYSENDKWYRYLRDLTLGPIKYNELMLCLMEKQKFDVNQIMAKLWMTENDVKALHNDGHIIGLHSYSHPTTMHTLSYDQQEKEYRCNYEHLSELLAEDITAMSHPNGSYNSDTLDILTKMGSKIGFRSSMGTARIQSNLEIPRKDHANVYIEMTQ